MNKKIATITYHAAYNYGANLQAFALQKFVEKIIPNCEYSIINLRTDVQKRLYKTVFQKKGIKNQIKKVIMMSEKKKLIEKEKKFEDFISDYLNITKEFSNTEDVRKNLEEYDYYISGSDQIWNIRLPDFSYAYYLEFTNNPKKISYAASFGAKNFECNTEEKQRIYSDLKEYNYLSVRENKSLIKAREILGSDKNIEINIDPTMLLTKEEWEKIIPKEKLIKEKYIFYYDVKDTKENAVIAKKIEKKLKKKIVVSRYQGLYTYMQKFKRKFDTGPIEFLNLIKYADTIVTSSFHGVVFAILLEKPFLVINGEKDNRIKDLLENMGFEDKSVNIENYTEKCENIYNIDFDVAHKYLVDEREKSKKYLRKSLEYGGIDNE